jgi:hypothetical protein
MNKQFKEFAFVLFPLLAVIIAVPSILYINSRLKAKRVYQAKLEVAKNIAEEQKQSQRREEREKQAESLKRQKEVEEESRKASEWVSWAKQNFAIAGVEVEPSSGTIFMTILPSKISTKQNMEMVATMAAKSYCFQTNSEYANVRIVDPYTQKILASGDYWHEVKESTGDAIQVGEGELQVNVPSLYGLSPTELRREFVGLSGGGAESSATINNWKGWDEVSFYFNGKGRLAQISFVPKKPFSRLGAEDNINQIFGLRQGVGNRVRTVNLSPKYGGGDVESVDIFFDIGWRE